jgi:hypothetical protein
VIAPANAAKDLDRPAPFHDRSPTGWPLGRTGSGGFCFI